MDLLVLGGSGFVGRHVVAAALDRGWRVTTFNRGTRAPAAGVTPLTGDRERPADLDALADRRFDLVVDTWAGAPTAVRDAAARLASVAGHYAYVSSGSVYADLATGPDEASATVAADPDAGATEYAADKRGAELAAVRVLGPGRVLLARAGLILGPGEDVGRLPWWLRRLHRGGPTLAPGPPDLGLQLVDARDLAAFLLDAGAGGHAGPVNVVGRPGATTMGEVLELARAATGGHAELVWLPPEAVAAAGLQPWIELPLWMPPDHPARGLLHKAVDRAHALGLRTRPVAETVAATWAWLQALDGPPPQRGDRPPVGLAPEREAAALAAFTRR